MHISLYTNIPTYYKIYSNFVKHCAIRNKMDIMHLHIKILNSIILRRYCGFW